MGKNTTIKSLDLSFIQIKDELRTLADALRSNKTLVSLDLSGINAGCEMNHIFDALKENTTLTQLNIAYNRIEVIDMAEVLKMNTTLLILNLAYNKLGKGLHTILQAMKINTTLTELNLADASFDKANTQAIVTMMGKNRTLTRLTVAGYDHAPLYITILYTHYTPLQIVTWGDGGINNSELMVAQADLNQRLVLAKTRR